MTDEERNLIERYIEPNPYRPGLANARIIPPHSVSVWALIGYLDAVHGNIAKVAEDYELPFEAVQAALAYYRQHQSVIDARIAANVA